MFPNEYFAPVYFAPVYFERPGGVAPTPTPIRRVVFGPGEDQKKKVADEKARIAARRRKMAAVAFALSRLVKP